jgi:hypothetical protein
MLPESVDRRSMRAGKIVVLKAPMYRWFGAFLAGFGAVFAALPAVRAQTAGNQLGPAVLAATPGPSQLPPQPLQPSDKDTASAIWRFFRDGEWYFAWGYNKEFWAHSDIHVHQGALGNDFTLYGVSAHDDAGLTADPFGPQYSFRIGRFFDDNRNFGLELNFDHTKYETTLGPSVAISGTVAGAPRSGTVQLNNMNFYEVLHNGANHLMFNAVYRLPLIGETNETLSVAAIGRAGVGVMLPHTTDTIFGATNDVGSKSISNAIGFTNGWWQLNGWTTGVEGGFRVVLYKPVYLELTDKIAYAKLYDLPAAQGGTISQSLWMNEIVLTLGFTYDGAALFGHPSP